MPERLGIALGIALLLLFLLCVLVRSMVEQRLRRTDAVVRLSVALGRRSAGAGRLVLERCE